MDRGMDQDEDDKTPRKKAQEEERKEEGIARSPLERRKSDTPSKDKKDIALELAKVKRERDLYKKDCKDKERRIQEYYGILAQNETQLEVKTEELLDKDLEIQRITDYYKKTQNDALTETATLKEALEILEKETAETRKIADVEKKDLKELLIEKEQEIIKLKEETSKTSHLAQEERKQTINQLRKQVEELVKKTDSKDKQIKELVENLQVKDAENAVYKQDFETERSDRQRIHDQYEELKTKVEEWSVQRKADQEAMANLGEVMKGQEEEIQVLTAQVNAYSRECEKQKGLVAQNQERHKTEIQELNEKLTNEQKSKQQLESQLTTMNRQFDSVSASKESLQKPNQQLVNELTILRQQVDSLTASKESLLTAYNQEQAMVTSLEQQLQRTRKESAAMKKANEVLKDKVLNLKQQLSSQTANPVVSSHPNIPPKISMRQNTINFAPPTPSADHLTRAQQGNGNAEIVLSKGQQVAPLPHAEQPDSFPEDTPLMTKEEMSRLFKWQNQQEDSGQATITQRPQQVEDLLVKERRRQELAQKADEAVLEAERMRKQPPRKTMLPHTSSKQESVNQQQPKKKIKQQQAAADDSDTDIEENVLLEGIDDEIHEMAEEVHEMSRCPDTQEVLFDDNDRPYDPNLVCRKCGKQYREGEIQKLKRHLSTNCDNDDCDGNIRKDQMTKEIHDMAEEVRGMSRRPGTQEVLVDNEDSPLPYDPNLVCPKCGRQYRVGEIQKLKRHMVEFCTGKR